MRFLLAATMAHYGKDPAKVSLTESHVGRSRILVVDDDRDHCELLSKILVLRRYEVDVALNGPDALELAEHHAYRLALIDYRMPGMNGIELYTRIRKLRPGLVGIFLTGYPSIDTVYPAIGAGVERILAKPPDLDELFELVEQYAGEPA